MMMTFSYPVVSLSILILLSISISSVSSISSFGSYSIKQPKLTPALEDQLSTLLELGTQIKRQKEKEGDYGETQEEYDDLDIDFSNFESLSDLVPLLKRVFMESEPFLEKYRRLIVRKGVLVISLPHWLLGWNSYALVSKLVDNTSSGEGCIKVQLSSPMKYSEREDISKNGVKIDVEFHMNDKGRLSMSTKTRGKRGGGGGGGGGQVPENVLDRMQSLIRAHTKKSLKSEVVIVAARRKLIATDTAANAKSKAEKKRVELDMIMNPDKYKNKGSTVRNPKQIGKNAEYAPSVSGRDKRPAGRYTPSTATQSRRVVTRSR